MWPFFLKPVFVHPVFSHIFLNDFFKGFFQWIFSSDFSKSPSLEIQCILSFSVGKYHFQATKQKGLNYFTFFPFKFSSKIN